MKAKLLTVKDAAERCGVTPATIRNWLRGAYPKNGGWQEYAPGGQAFPKPVHVGRNVRIKESDFEDWFKNVAAAG